MICGTVPESHSTRSSWSEGHTNLMFPIRVGRGIFSICQAELVLSIPQIPGCIYIFPLTKGDRILEERQLESEYATRAIIGFYLEMHSLFSNKHRRKGEFDELSAFGLKADSSISQTFSFFEQRANLISNCQSFITVFSAVSG